MMYVCYVSTIDLQFDLWERFNIRVKSQIDISTVAILRSGVFVGRDIFEIWYLHLNPLKETLFPPMTRVNMIQ